MDHTNLVLVPYDGLAYCNVKAVLVVYPKSGLVRVGVSPTAATIDGSKLSSLDKAYSMTAIGHFTLANTYAACNSVSVIGTVAAIRFTIRFIGYSCWGCGGYRS